MRLIRIQAKPDFFCTATIPEYHGLGIYTGDTIPNDIILWSSFFNCSADGFLQCVQAVRCCIILHYSISPTVLKPLKYLENFGYVRLCDSLGIG